MKNCRCTSCLARAEPEPLTPAQTADYRELSRAMDAADENIVLARESIKVPMTMQSARSARSSLLRAVSDVSTVMAMLGVIDLHAREARGTEDE